MGYCIKLYKFALENLVYYHVNFYRINMRKVLLVILLVVTLSFVSSLSCSAVIPADRPKKEVKEDKRPVKIPESKGAYKHVIIIGVDGGGAFFSHATTPETFKITGSGAFSYQTKTSYPTISAQCWGSMLHGVLPEFHRLSNDIVSSRPYDPESIYPSIFRITREAFPDAKLASFCNWNPINHGIVENNLNVTEGTGDDPAVASQVVSYIQNNDPTLVFVQFDSVDGAGHGNGYGTAKHLAQLSSNDELIGQIYDAIVRKGIEDNTLFIVAADHGGTPQGGHGGDTYAERYVFLGISGKTVEPRSQIIDAEVRDIPAIAAYALGLDIPETWTGHVPTGVFQGVTAGERKEAEIPVSEHRKRTAEPTLSLSEVKALLANHDVMAYLPFDGDASDAFGVTATSTSGKLYYYDACFGKGIALDDGYITLNNASVGTNSFSAAFWMKTNGVSGDPVIISNKDWSSSGNDGFVLSLRQGDIKFNAGWKASGSKTGVTAPLPLDYKEGWVHVILTVNRAERKMSIYYDFKLEETTDIQDDMAGVSFDALNLNIGQDGTGSYDSHLAAQIDELIITRDALSQDDITAMKKFYTGE